MLGGVLLFLVGGARAHVSLLWPPARGPGLDFLDNLRTEGDCGIEPGLERTTLKAGSSLNVSWHLGYPHNGGYRLNLVIPGEPPRKLIPSGSAEWETQDARFSQSHLVTLPQDVTCNNCYIKLERQAAEWGGNYKFRSCSDVEVTNGEEDCGPGTREPGSPLVPGGACICPRGRVGDRCQYSTDCKDDMDCNGPKDQGKCIVTENAVFPKGQCFCAPGWQGEQCELKSEWSGESAKEYNEADFKTESLGGGTKLFWRRLPSGTQIEMILSAPTTSWLALGWRPSDSTTSCQAFPSLIIAPKKARNLHAMDCTDMVVASAREGRGRVGDFYTRDRSTPLPDKFYGGKDDLESSFAWEEDGTTTLRVIKSTEGGVADHALEGKMHVIWAFGQQKEFYDADQLKYHGRTNRGIGQLELGSSGGAGVSALQLGLGISCVLLLLLLALQVTQNLDKKLSCLNPASYRAFN